MFQKFNFKFKLHEKLIEGKKYTIEYCNLRTNEIEEFQCEYLGRNGESEVFLNRSQFKLHYLYEEDGWYTEFGYGDRYDDDTPGMKYTLKDAGTYVDYEVSVGEGMLCLQVKPKQSHYQHTEQINLEAIARREYEKCLIK